MSNIFVDDRGEGFPFVLVHGYLGSSEMWCFQKDYFSKNFRVIAPALPGFGESHNAQSLNSINTMAKKIAEKAVESSSAVKMVEIKHLQTMKDEAGKDVSVVDWTESKDVDKAISEAEAALVTAEARVTAVWVNKTPVIPLIKIKGTNTATSTIVVAMIAKDTCFAPL